jgi:hypothetical protein
MNEHLERIVVADEDARAHVEAARGAADARVAAVRNDCRVRAEQAAAAKQRALEAELQQIQEAADRTISARQAARATYAEARRRVAEPIVAEAAGVFARIVREGAAPRRIT